MGMDKRRINVKKLIEKGHITTLREIPEYYQITLLVKYLKSSHQRLTKYFNDASLFRFKEISKIGEYFEVNDQIMCNLVLQQMKIDKAKKRTPQTSKKGLTIKKAK